MALAKLRDKTVIAFDQGDAPGGRLQDVRGERPHARTNLDKVISGLGIKACDDRLGEIRIEKEILTEHLARTHPDLLETGTEFGFGHGKIHKALSRLVPAGIRNIFCTLVPKLFTEERGALLGNLKAET
jgi:hypothetical protein